MKNKIFDAVTICGGTLIVVFLCQTSSLASNEKKNMIRVDAVSHDEKFIAQATSGPFGAGGFGGGFGNIFPNNADVLAQAISSAQTFLGDALAIADSEAVGGSEKDALAVSIAQASTIIGDAAALSSSTAQSDQAAAAIAVSNALTIIGDALSVAESNAVSGDGAPAVASSLASAQSVLGSATASSSSSASSE